MKPTAGKHTEDDLKQIQEPNDMCKEKLGQYVEVLKLAESQSLELA